MSSVSSRWLVVLLMLGGSRALPVFAADAPDAALLEFLGSVDSDDQAWHAYLAQADAAHTTPANAASATSSSTPAPDANPPNSASPPAAPASSATPAAKRPPSAP